MKAEGSDWCLWSSSIRPTLKLPCNHHSPISFAHRLKSTLLPLAPLSRVGVPYHQSRRMTWRACDAVGEEGSRRWRIAMPIVSVLHSPFSSMSIKENKCVVFFLEDSCPTSLALCPWTFFLLLLHPASFDFSTVRKCVYPLMRRRMVIHVHLLLSRHPSTDVR